MPKPHSVKLTYTNGTLKPDPDPVLVRVGDTLTFELVSPADGEIDITMDDPHLFSAAGFKKGNAPIRVNRAVHTTYSCELKVGGVVVAQVSGAGGGSIDPALGDGGGN